MVKWNLKRREMRVCVYQGDRRGCSLSLRKVFQREMERKE
jgi:hypothetical protein